MPIVQPAPARFAAATELARANELTPIHGDPDALAIQPPSGFFETAWAATGNSIEFNGSPRASCEPFVVGRIEKDRRGTGTVWCFCKTERMPYDLCVQCALVVLRHHFGSRFKVGSDGTDDDWTEARNLVQNVLGYGGDFAVAAPT
jgi:hypothetical protein